MADEQELTPEERLLKVIQKGESDALPLNAGGLGDGETGAEPPLAIAVGPRQAGQGMRLVNRLLAAVAVIFLLLAGYETYEQTPKPATTYAAAELSIDGPEAPLVAPVSLAETLEMIRNRRIFGPAPVVDPGTKKPGEEQVPELGWRKYARENLVLMGLSDVKTTDQGVEKIRREAIVMDNKVKKMHFLEVGKTLVVADREATVSRIEGKQLELRVEDDVLTIE